MALDPSFAESFVNDERHRIAGRSVRPFCAWHIALLQTLESPFLIEGAKIDPHDALTLIAVCSLRYPETRTRRPRNLVSWWLTRSQSGFQKLNNSILAYIGDFLKKPEFAIHTPDTDAAPKRRGQPPEIFQAVWDVIHASKWMEERVWDLPIGKLYWYQMMALKEKYDVDVIDEEEKKLQEDLEAHIAAKKQKEAAANGS